jgi:alanine racemase
MFDIDEEITRPTYLEVSVANFRYNIAQIRKMVGEGIEIMPVIKANAYGTYLNRRMDLMEEFNIVAVANVDEGVYMRKLGYKNEIFVLNQPYVTEIDKILKYDIAVGISSHDFADALTACGQPVHVHVEIGTGMGRTGIHPNRVAEYFGYLGENIIVDGIYTHFSSADNDDEYSMKQLASFNRALESAEAIKGKLKYVHAAASNALINYPQARFNMVRPGLIMYGYPTADDTLEKIDIKPVASLRSHISFLKDVKEGTSVGYNRSYITTRPSKIATVPIGYADGMRRTFSNGWPVVIRGQKAPIVGKICMDSFMVDVTDLPEVALDDEVIIWDDVNIGLQDLADKCDTITYEILCGVGERVPRKFVE